MDKRLVTWIAKRRREQCPSEVLTNVSAQIRGERSLIYQVYAVALLVAIALVASALMFSGRKTPELTETPNRGPSRVLEETQLSLAVISYALHKTGDSSRSVLINDAFPALHQGYLKAKRAFQTGANTL